MQPCMMTGGWVGGRGADPKLVIGGVATKPPTAKVTQPGNAPLQVHRARPTAATGEAPAVLGTRAAAAGARQRTARAPPHMLGRRREDSPRAVTRPSIDGVPGYPTKTRQGNHTW
jgi:hypothetical protein